MYFVHLKMFDHIDNKVEKYCGKSYCTNPRPILGDQWTQMIWHEQMLVMYKPGFQDSNPVVVI